MTEGRIPIVDEDDERFCWVDGKRFVYGNAFGARTDGSDAAGALQRALDFASSLPKPNDQVSEGVWISPGEYVIRQGIQDN